MVAKFVKMVVGSAGSEVTKAQKLLVKAGSSIKVTGKYGIGMYSAVKAFQKRNGLPATGEIDAKTMKKLAEYDKPAKKTIRKPAKKR